MSNLIPKIKEEIKAIEDTVNSDMSKEEVYDKLIKAYNLHKDIIALYEDSDMEIQDNSEMVIQGLKTQLTNSIEKSEQLDLANDGLTIENETLKEQVRVLEAWKDGANLEGEQLKTQLTIAKASLESRDKLVENYKTVFNHISQSAGAAISELTNLQTMVNPNIVE